MNIFSKAKLSGAILFLLASSSALSAVTVRDIGVFGLYSHDLFQWDRKNEVSLENGKLDLSTIFDYEDGKRWKKGGNTKNSENAPVYSVTMDLVAAHKTFMKEAEGSKEEKFAAARIKTVALFKSMVEKSFSKITGESFPSVGIDAEVVNEEQAAMRCLHDILPGHIKLYNRIFRKSLKVTDWKFTKTRLNKMELDQEVKFFDGQYDPEYLAIGIPVPFKNISINLRKLDKGFVEKFSDFDFEQIQLHLKEIGETDGNISQLEIYDTLLEMAMKSICPKGNKWIDQSIECD